MSSLQIHFGIPSASTSSNGRPHIILPPPGGDIAGLHHRPNPNRRQSQTRPSGPVLQSSRSSRPAAAYSSTSLRTSFIPTQSASAFSSHWANQDPFDSSPPPRPRRSIQLAPLSNSNNNRPSQYRRANGNLLPFAPSPPISQAGGHRQPRHRLPPLTSGHNNDNSNSNNPRQAALRRNPSTTSTTSRAPLSSFSDSDSEVFETMPQIRATRKRRATNEIPSSSASDSPAASTRSNKRRATAARPSSSSSPADTPEPSSTRAAAAAAAPKRPAPVRKPRLKKEVVKQEEPIVFDSSDIEGDKDEVIDLVDKDEAPEPEPQPKEKNTIKLGTFQCVICMDGVTDLTVTHCGHLFCSECLHSSLHIDASKKVCPICRQKVETNPAAGKFTSKSKGFWPLELKLMTSKRSGKRAAR